MRFIALALFALAAFVYYADLGAPPVDVEPAAVVLPMPAPSRPAVSMSATSISTMLANTSGNVTYCTLLSPTTATSSSTVSPCFATGATITTVAP